MKPIEPTANCLLFSSIACVLIYNISSRHLEVFEYLLLSDLEVTLISLSIQ